MSSESNLIRFDPLFIRFILVGIMNTAAGLSAIFLFLNLFNADYWLSTFWGNIIGAAVSYYLNRSFTFSSKTSIKKSLPRFIAVVIVCYFAAFSFGKAAAEFLYLIFPHFLIMTEDMLAVMLGTSVYTVLNFLGQKYLVFGIKSN
ncbi:GtrA family protein [Metabacillus idriensis]|uniref:GtrA family protein n=1 Tax=Metabacillus idriensis TaxID=324768 RepID=A0A6I2M6W7_9BACI|nr:GtrA family protein [Metabacillus idriensis]MCM3595757.1 GtrA family protein [Metabacillus idriensis]MRX53868.1 GtrA family protein [Metabacillus idriensis]